jgi:hypothetical protein
VIKQAEMSSAIAVLARPANATAVVAISFFMSSSRDVLSSFNRCPSGSVSEHKAVILAPRQLIIKLDLLIESCFLLER